MKTVVLMLENVKTAPGVGFGFGDNIVIVFRNGEAWGHVGRYRIGDQYWEWISIPRVREILDECVSFSWRKVSRLELLLLTGCHSTWLEENLKLNKSKDLDGTDTIHVVELP